jgi:integrase
MKPMRHRNIETTMNYYTRVEDHDKAAAIDKLGRIPEANMASATGRPCK